MMENNTFENIHKAILKLPRNFIKEYPPYEMIETLKMSFILLVFTDIEKFSDNTFRVFNRDACDFVKNNNGLFFPSIMKNIVMNRKKRIAFFEREFSKIDYITMTEFLLNFGWKPNESVIYVLKSLDHLESN